MQSFDGFVILVKIHVDFLNILGNRLNLPLKSRLS